MNAFGKTLLVCNLLVALCVPIFFMAVRSRQVNWKEYAESLKAQLDVAQKNSKAKDEDVSKLDNDAKAQHVNANMIAKQQQVDKEKFQELLEIEKVKLTAKDLDLNKAMLDWEREKQTSQRLQLEMEATNQALEKYARDKLDLQAAINKYRKEADDFRSEKNRYEELAKNLAQNVREYEARFRELAGSGSRTFPTSNIVKNPNEPNPPRVKVKGKILQISRDAHDGAGVLVMLSVGIDQGVNKDHTLEVYRTAPAPQYLGRLRIIEATARDSIGRLISRSATDGRATARRYRGR